MRKNMAKWLVRIALAVPTTILLVLLLIGGLLLTHPGLQLTLWAAQKALPQLSVGESQGALMTSFRLSQVEFVDPSLYIDLKANEIELDLDVECLFAPEVCVDKLRIDGLDFALSDVAASEAPVEETPPLKEFSLPLPVSVKAIEFADIKLDILGTQVSWQQFTSAVAMQGRVLTLSQTLWQDIQLSIAASEAAPSSNDTAASPSPIELPEVWIPLDVNVEKIDVRDFELTGESGVIVNHLGLSAKAVGNHVAIKQLKLVMPEVDADLRGNIDLLADYPLDAKLNARLKQGELAGQSLALTTAGSVAKLNLDASFDGVIQALLTGDIQPLDPDLPFDATLSQGSLQWPLSGSSDYQAQVEKLSLKGSLSGYQVDAKLAAQGEAIPDVDLQLSGQGDLNYIDLKLLKLGTLGGQIIGEASAHWKDQVRWQASIGLEDIQPGLQWPDLPGQLSGSLTTSGHLTAQGGWYVELPLLSLQGELRDYPLTLNGELIAQDPRGNGEFQLVSDSLNIAHGPNTIFASGTLDKNWQLDLELNLPDFAKSVPDLRGRMQGEVKLRGELEQPDILLDIAVNDTEWQQEASLQQLLLKGRVQPLPVPQGDLSLSATQLRYQDQLIDSVALDFKGHEQEHQLTLDLLSELASASLKLTGSLQQQPQLRWQGALERAKLTSEQGSWQLANRTALAFDGETNQVSVQAHCWTQSGSKLCLSQDIEVGESGEAELALSGFDFEQIKMFMPKQTELTGSADGQVWAKWAPESKPQASVKLELAKGQVVQKLDAPLTLGWENIALQAELKEDFLKASWLFDLTDNGDIQGQASVKQVLLDSRSIDGKLKISDINLAMLQPLLGEFSKVDANIHSDLTYSGPVLHPQLHGDFTVDRLVAKGEVTPIDVDEGKLVVAFSGYQAKLDALLKTPDGELSIDGQGDWQDLKAWSTQARVYAEELNINLPPMVQLKVKPDMTISANPEVAKIEGDIALPWGRINIQQLPPSAIAVSSDEIMLDENYQVIERESALPMNIETNINISMGDDFKLSAFGLEGGLKGNLKVSQKGKGPYVLGEVNIIEGTYRSFGQDLQIKQGKILMNGPVDMPYVAIEAIRNPDNTRDDVTAGIRVNGPATEPVVTLFSDPEMPQANKLSYLLRGQNIDAETGGNMMTTTLIGLSLAKSGKVVGEIGQAFGVQDLQLDTAGSGDDSQVTVSGYILPGLQVKYGVGIFNSLGEFTVRYRLMTDLYVEAISGVTSAVDLLYQFEFD